VLSIDLNCDMGEGMTTDEAIFPFISSANIACGGHAGDTDTMRRSIGLALQYGAAIGAHPSYPDRAGFGRTDILETIAGRGDRALHLSDLAQILADQLGQLQAICREAGVRLHHVKPHGALYNRAAKDEAVSAIICRVVAEADPSLLLYGLSGSGMRLQAAAAGLGFVSEVFADRTYRADGSLTPRTEPGALIHDPETMIGQVLLMIREGKVIARGGVDVPIAADTICLHGDGGHAVEFAAKIRGELDRLGIAVTSPWRQAIK
jgi:UPF0271 protein